MNILDFYNAVSAGNTEKVREYHREHKSLPVNKNFVYHYLNPRIIRLPLIIAFYEGRLETAAYLWKNGADLDIVCQKCQKTPREFMPEGFLEGNCRIMSFRVFKDRVYETAFHHSKTVEKNCKKNEEYIKEMYEYATNEDLFKLNGTNAIKKEWSDEKLKEWLRLSGPIDLEHSLRLFRNGDYLWPYILTTARRLKTM